LTPMMAAGPGAVAEAATYRGFAGWGRAVVGPAGDRDGKEEKLFRGKSSP